MFSVTQLANATPRPRRITAVLALLAVTSLVEAFIPQPTQAQTNLKTLHTFRGLVGSDGSSPMFPLIRDSAGNVYGTTLYGGNRSCATNGCGTVFKVDSHGTETVLYRFTGGTDGEYPKAGVVRDSAGNLYGTTSQGGDLSCANGSGCGTVFKIDSVGNKTVLYTFAGGTDGSSPLGGLLRDAGGTLYGTTQGGGVYSEGTVFKVDAAGRETVLYSFPGGTGGASPNGGLVLDSSRNLYGFTQYGGNSTCGRGCGTVFKLEWNCLQIGFDRDSDFFI
jgi:uncharacterized repeat protein (TIGR03803 family)